MTADHTPESIINRACAVAWGARPAYVPLVKTSPAPLALSEMDERVVRLMLVLNDHVRYLAPKLPRSDALQLGNLLLDIRLAVGNGWKFMPGPLRRTPGIEGMTPVCLHALLQRHLTGDWGDVSERDREANETALVGNGRLLSSYSDVRDGDLFWTKVWVLTDPSVAAGDGDQDFTSRLRSCTTVLLPSEY